MLLTADARGVFPIAPTPFHDDGTIDVDSIDRLTDFYLSIGATGLTVLGQLGEAPKLEHAESVAVAARMIRRAAGLPVWCQGTAAPPSVAGLTFVGWQEPIDCGGVAVFPNDVIVVDQDGAVLIPAALLDDVLAAAVEQERLEGWIMGEVERGAALPGLYPPNEENRARYEAWLRDGTP